MYPGLTDRTFCIGIHCYGLGTISPDSACNNGLGTTLVLPAMCTGVKLYSRVLTLWLAILGEGNRRSSFMLRMGIICLWSTASSKFSILSK